MSNFLRNPNKNKTFAEVAAVIAALGLMLTGCSSSNADSAPTPKPTAMSTQSQGQWSRVYSSDGTMITKYNNGYRDVFITNSRCDGPDIIEVTTSRIGGNWSEVYQRGVNDAACADGKLTPSDFPNWSQ